MIIKSLDCTLRDGGYVNLWNFGADNICKIINNLTNSGIEFVELGFLKQCQYDNNITLFNSVSDFDKFIPLPRSDKTLYLGMITFGQYDLSLIPERRNTNIDGFLSRSPTPYPKGNIDYNYYKQVCVYGFKPDALQFYCNSERGKIEQIEDIEILRFIESGWKVQYIEVASETVAVDTPNDLAKVNRIMKEKGY